MTVPANLTYNDIQTRVANSLRLPATNATEMAKIQNLVNEVYRDVAAKSDWWWLLKRAVINTAEKITAGTANVTLGSAAITFSVAPGLDTTGYVLLVPGNANDSNAVYRIATNAGGGVAATLDAAYTGATNAAVAYRLYKDSYSLPADTGKVLNVKRFGFIHPLTRLGIEDLSTIKLTDTSENKPQMYSVFDSATTGDPTSARLLQVHPYPDKAYRLEVFYKQNLNTELAGAARPLIPDDFVQVLVYGALARGYAIFLSDTDRAKTFQALFNDLLALMVAQQREYASDRPGIAPIETRTGSIRRRRGSGFTLGSLFDRFPAEP